MNNLYIYIYMYVCIYIYIKSLYTKFQPNHRHRTLPWVRVKFWANFHCIIWQAREDRIVPEIKNLILTSVTMCYKLKLRVSFTSDMIEPIKTHPVLKVSSVSLFGTNTVSFINFWLEKVHQDSVCPRSSTLESWRTGWFLIPMELVSTCLEMYSEPIL